MASRRPRRRSSSAVAIRTPDDPISLFISYRRADSAGHVGRLHDHLREIPAFRAGGIFLDTDSIKGGADFVKAMDCAVRFADVMLVVIGRDWVSIRARGQRRIDHPEDPVRREIRRACKESVPIVPVLVRGATMPSAEDLPSAIVRLTKRNAIEVSDTRFTHDVERLVYAIQNAAVTSTRKRPRPPRRLDAGPFLALGQRALKQRDYVNARRLMQTAIEAQPDSTDMKIEMSRAFQFEALEHTRDNNYGSAETLLKQADKAVRSALATDPANIAALVQLAFVTKDRGDNYRQMNRKKDARAKLDLARKIALMIHGLDKRDARAWNCRAGVAYLNGQIDRAIAFGQRAVELAPRYSWAFYGLACAYEARAARASGTARRAALEALIDTCDRLFKLERNPRAERLSESEREHVRAMKETARISLKQNT
jgi:tetratricopeptide (TPR) repeat protein